MNDSRFDARRHRKCSATLWNERQRSDSHSIGLDHDHAAGLESGHKLRQIGFEQRRLIGGAVLAAVTEQNHGR